MELLSEVAAIVTIGTPVGTLIIHKIKKRRRRERIVQRLDEADKMIKRNLYKDALEILKEKELKNISSKKEPELYARFKKIEGVAYLNLANGKHAEDYLKKAQLCIEETLPIYVVEKKPLEYSKAQLNLSTIFLELAVRDLETYVGKAISACNEALKVYEKNYNREGLCKVYLNLSVAQIYLSNIRNKKENLESAMKLFKKVSRNEDLKRCSNDCKFWNNIGAAYYYISKSREKKKNLELAIKNLEKGLENCNIEKEPENYNYAALCKNLGAAYMELATISDKEENLERAMQMFEISKNIWTKKKYPSEWTGVQNNLQNLYMMQTGTMETKKKILRESIAFFEKALSIPTLEAPPRSYADLENNLGNTYKDLAQFENKDKNLNEALKAYQKALHVRKKENYPLDWAMIQNNIGIIYLYLAEAKDENSTKNIDAAIDAYNNALMVRSRRKHPIDWGETHMNLGLVYLLQGEITNHEKSFTKAIESFEKSIDIYEAEDHHLLVPTLCNLGAAYGGLANFRDKKEKLNNAKSIFEKALKICKTKGCSDKYKDFARSEIKKIDKILDNRTVALAFKQ